MTGGSFDGVSGEALHLAAGVGIDPEVASSKRGDAEEEQNPKGDLVSATPPSRIS